jgi:hypothetical protein
MPSKVENSWGQKVALTKGADLDAKEYTEVMLAMGSGSSSSGSASGQLQLMPGAKPKAKAKAKCLDGPKLSPEEVKFKELLGSIDKVLSNYKQELATAAMLEVPFVEAGA